MRAWNIVGPKWTLQIVRELMTGPRRPAELLRSLPGIPRNTLHERLSRLVELDLATRSRYSRHPARFAYELTAAGWALAPPLAEIARWGYRNCWTEPVHGELVDVAAILRLARGLLVGMPDGRLLLSVTQPTRTVRFLVASAGGDVAVTEVVDRPARLDARVAGGEREWIASLAPGHRFDALSILGDRDLALAMLRSLIARNRPN